MLKRTPVKSRSNPAHTRLDRVFSVKQRESCYIIHAHPFCKHLGIRVPSTQSFVRPEIDPNGILLLDLRDTTNVGGWRRKQRIMKG